MPTVTISTTHRALLNRVETEQGIRPGGVVARLLEQFAQECEAVGIAEACRRCDLGLVCVMKEGKRECQSS